MRRYDVVPAEGRKSIAVQFVHVGPPLKSQAEKVVVGLRVTIPRYAPTVPGPIEIVLPVAVTGNAPHTPIEPLK